MSANSPESPVLDELDSALSDIDSEEVFVVNPSEKVMRATITSVKTNSEPIPTINILAEKDVMKNATNDFRSSASVADLSEQGRLHLRFKSDLPRNTLLVSPEDMKTFVQFGQKTTVLSATATSFVDSAHNTVRETWEAANVFSVRTPPISRVHRTLEADLNTSIKNDFVKMMDSKEAVRGETNNLDAVAVLVLAAAKNEELLYDLGKWGEDVGVASQAKFSRIKQRLEDVGLITTEKVPLDVGRPRQRLILGSEELIEGSAEDLISIAHSHLDH